MSTPDLSTIQRQLQIKIGSFERLFKERKLYREEARGRQRHLDRMVAEGGDEWEIRHATRLVDESKRTMKDVEERLDKATGELDRLICPLRELPEFAEQVKRYAALQDSDSEEANS